MIYIKARTPRESIVMRGLFFCLCCRKGAVAETISGSGLIAYYNSRSAYARQEADAAYSELSLYDRPEAQRDFVHRSSRGEMYEATRRERPVGCPEACDENVCC